jgi:hypothetical protein
MPETKNNQTVNISTESKMTNETTPSPRTLGMYYGCMCIADFYTDLDGYAKPSKEEVSAQAVGFYTALQCRNVLLKLKYPTNDVGAYDVYGADHARSNGFDLGGFIIQDGKELWVASLIDAGVAVEMEVAND